MAAWTKCCQTNTPTIIIMTFDTNTNTLERNQENKERKVGVLSDNIFLNLNFTHEVGAAAILSQVWQIGHGKTQLLWHIVGHEYLGHQLYSWTILGSV